MNILHNNTLDNTGGATKVAYRLKDGLKKRGYNSWMLIGCKFGKSLDIKPISWKKYIQMGLNLQRINRYKRISRMIFPLLNTAHRTYLRLKEIVR